MEKGTPMTRRLILTLAVLGALQGCAAEEAPEEAPGRYVQRPAPTPEAALTTVPEPPNPRSGLPPPFPYAGANAPTHPQPRTGEPPPAPAPTPPASVKGQVAATFSRKSPASLS